MIAQRAATTSPRSPSARSSAARTSWSSTATRSSSTTTATVIARAPQFAEELLVCDVDVEAARSRAPARHARAAGGARDGARRGRPRVVLDGGPAPTRRRRAAPVAELLDADAEVYAALVLGTRDYVTQERLRARRLGLSGGIDSTLVALHRRRRARRRARDLRDDALAATRRRARATTRTRWPRTSASSCSSCRSARRWRPTTSCWPTSSPGREPDITEENLQARIRGNLLMALSNKFGWLVLTTGNKSEMSVGYSTLYGDSAGGFAVIKDVPKTLVYRLVAERGAPRPASRRCPTSIVTRPPSAELRPDQRDAGLAAALRGRSTRSSRATSRRTSAASSSSPAACRRPTSTASSASSTSPSTSAARTRRASRSPRRRSGATGGCRSPTATADDRARHRSREPARDRRRVRPGAGRTRRDGGLHGHARRDGRRTTCPARRSPPTSRRRSRPSG